MTPLALPPRSVPHRGEHASAVALASAWPPAASKGAQATVAGVVYVCDGAAWGPALTVAQNAALAVSGAGNPVFVDDFKRTDTAAGSLGAGWVLKGPYVSSYPLPASSNGQIIGGAYVEPNSAIVYAHKALRQTPGRVRVRWSWSDLANGGTGFRTLAVILSPSVNLIDTMLHITIINSQVLIQKRLAGGAFVNMNATTGMTGGSLALVDTPHIVTIDVSGSTVRVRVDDAFDQTVTDAEIPAIVGANLVVEHYSTGTVRWPMRVLGVEAYI